MNVCGSAAGANAFEIGLTLGVRSTVLEGLYRSITESMNGPSPSSSTWRIEAIHSALSTTPVPLRFASSGSSTRPFVGVGRLDFSSETQLITLREEPVHEATQSSIQEVHREHDWQQATYAQYRNPRKLLCSISKTLRSSKGLRHCRVGLAAALDYETVSSEFDDLSAGRKDRVLSAYGDFVGGNLERISTARS
ncbi:hypothetical protein BJ508DRAFT_155375 [Ascobolus immersus RN42]|uniref:Uncharacterized protein n=1 Tax=Ascobolus immersus RN42 TaxID=1160509 RepID=A0A3N4HXK2_ASCIM|nr:hypothetical protein BJ508DRAFT_155375 [Ascobolus immersus RN42]